MKKKSLALIAILGIIVIIGVAFGYVKYTSTKNKEMVTQTTSKSKPQNAKNTTKAQICVLYITNYNPPEYPNYIHTNHGGIMKYDQKKCEASKAISESEERKYPAGRKYKCVCGDDAFIEKFENDVCGGYKDGNLVGCY